MENCELIWIAGGVGAVWLVSLLVMRLWTRRQVLRELLQQAENQELLDQAVFEPGPADQAALDLIRNWRKTYLWNWWPDSELSFQAVNEMSLELIRQIAAIYYPEEEQPELKASLADLVALHNRVGARLGAWLESLPMRPFKDVELKTILRYHEVYQSVKKHPAYTFMKRHHLDKVARWGWTLYNYANPLVWSSRLAYHGGKEMAARLLLARIVDLVGEEAMLLYGRRS